MSNLYEKTATQLAGLLLDKKISSVEITEAVLDRISTLEPMIHSFVNTYPDLALAMAKDADRRIEEGTAGPLTGIPIAIKDNMCLKSRKTTCGSKILANFSPPYDATVVKSVKD